MARHSLTVRITHWITTLSFAGLLVSGVAILLAHPRFYWGETGTVGTPSLFDLPLPFVLSGQTGWGRSLHFNTAWIAVLNGLVYVTSGIATQHFRRDLLPATGDLTCSALRRSLADHLRFTRLSDDARTYNVWQRLVYLSVVFCGFPLSIWTGLAMSPAITSVFPLVVTAVGGHQSARTIHFFVAVALVLFLAVHIVMVCLAGFASRMRAMTVGGPLQNAEHR